MADFTYPNSQNLSPSQVAALWQKIGAPTSVAHAFGYGINPSEGNGQTGVVLNTAYPSLPNYSPPTGSNSPEYSVGLYGINIYGDYPGGPPPASEAYTIGQHLAGNPQYQTQIAAGMFNQRGFEPWSGDAYVSGQPGSVLSSLGYSSPPQISQGVPFTGYVPLKGSSAPPPGNLDQGSAQSGVGPISPTNPNGLLNPSSLLGGSGSSGSSSSSSSGSVLGNCSGCLVKIPVVGGCGFSQCNAKALVGGLLAAGGALGMVVGVLIMVKTSVGLGALGRVARGAGSSSAAPTVASGLAEPAAEPADEAIPPVPEPTAVPVAAAVPDEDYDIDAELAAYYQGVQDGIDTPRRSPKQVGVMIPADAGGEDDF